MTEIILSLTLLKNCGIGILRILIFKFIFMFQKYTQLREDIGKILDSYDKTLETNWIEEISNEIAEELIMMIENKYWKIFEKEKSRHIANVLNDTSTTIANF